MIGVRSNELGALFGFAERQLYVYKRYWVWEVVWLFYSIVSVLSIGFLAKGLGSLGAGSASPGLAGSETGHPDSGAGDLLGSCASLAAHSPSAADTVPPSGRR